MAAGIILLSFHIVSVRADQHAEFCRNALAGERKLMNMDAPCRAPGEYLIGFEKPELLGCMSFAQVLSLQPLPGVLPRTRENAQRLATALARSIGAKVMAARFIDGFFAVQGATDQGVRNLARDPRVGSVEPNLCIFPQKQQ